jgi:transcriptional regulator with GAF, ATPase, and Fis domain
MGLKIEYSNVIPFNSREPHCEGFPGTIGASAPFLKGLDRVRLVSPTDATVLLEGETGTARN